MLTFSIIKLLILFFYRRGPARYKFQAQYDLDSLAVVNVRDLGSVRHAFKLLAFPDSRVFQCSNSTAKVKIVLWFINQTNRMSNNLHVI